MIFYDQQMNFALVSLAGGKISQLARENFLMKMVFDFGKKEKTPIFATPTEKGSVVQLVRMPPCHGGGRGFESRPVRKKLRRNPGLFCFCVNSIKSSLTKFGLCR
jgi:hypothetical protein